MGWEDWRVGRGNVFIRGRDRNNVSVSREKHLWPVWSLRLRRTGLAEARDISYATFVVLPSAFETKRELRCVLAVVYLQGITCNADASVRDVELRAQPLSSERL